MTPLVNQIIVFSVFVILAIYFAGLSFVHSGIFKFQITENTKQKNFISLAFFQLLSDDPFLYRVSMLFGYIFSFLMAVILVFQSIFNYFLVKDINTLPAFYVEVPTVFIFFLVLFCFISELVTVFISKKNWPALMIPAIILYLVLYPLARLFYWIRHLYETHILNVNDLKVKFDLLAAGNYEKILSDKPTSKEKGKYDQELTILQNALLFSKIRIRDCMIPRTEIEAVDIDASITEVKDKSISSGYSKIIVYRENIDNIEGYINAKELFKNPASIIEKLSPISFVPETMPANKLLHNFMQQHKSIAVVVDEYGGTAGIVTLEDIMEQIFGDIEDEHDTDDLIERKINQSEFVFASRLEIEYLNEQYGLQIPENENYDTLAGYILFHHHNLPKTNEIIIINNFSFKILKVTNTRIELVMLKVLNT